MCVLAIAESAAAACSLPAKEIGALASETGGTDGPTSSSTTGISDSATTEPGDTLDPPEPPAEAPPGTLPDAWILFDAASDDLDSRQIYAARANSREPVALTEGAANQVQPALSQDGRVLAFSSDRTGTWQIFTRELSTGLEEQITEVPNHGAEQPAWSPDGTSIVFHSGAGLYTVALATRELALIILEDNEYYNDLDAFQHAEFLPTGDALLADSLNEIVVIGLDGTRRHQVINGAPAVMQMPTLSADGSLVAYSVTCNFPRGMAIVTTPFASTRVGCTGPIIAEHSSGDSIHADWGEHGIVYELKADSTSSLRFISQNGEDWPLAVELAGSHPAWAENLEL